MIHINTPLLDSVSAEAQRIPRLRKNYNFHKEYSDTLQRLLNAMEPASYIRPHKHENPDKREVFFVLRGKALVLEFDPEGKVTEVLKLDPMKGVYGAEIAEKTFHTIISLQSGTVIYELKDGPYSPIDDKNFASWAPHEGSPEALPFLLRLVEQAGEAVDNSAESYLP
jgi:cupin fold WbuC family metalloprotein